MIKFISTVLLFLFSLINLFSQDIIEIVDIDTGENYSKSEKTRIKHKLGKDYEAFKISEEYASYHKKGSKKYGILKKGKIILPDIFSYEATENNHIILGINRLKGLYDLEEEKWDMPIMYEYISHLHNNYYVIKQEGLFYIVDYKGNKIINEKFNSVLKTHKNLITVVKNYKKGLLNLATKKYNIECKYDELYQVDNLHKFKIKYNNLYKIANIDGKIIFKNWYQYIDIPYNIKNRLIVKLNDKFGIIDTNENVILPIKYTYIRSKVEQNKSCVAKNKDNKYGCISINGGITLPFIYDNINIHGLAKRNDKYGIISFKDSLPKEKIPCIYDSLILNYDCIIAKKSNKYGVLNNNGETILKFEYDNILFKEVYIHKGFKYIIVTQKDSLYDFYDKNLKKINKQAYTYISGLIHNNRRNSNEYSYIVVKRNNKYGILDIKTGEEILPVIYNKKPFWIPNNLVGIQDNNKIGVFDFEYKHKIVVPIEYDKIISLENRNRNSKSLIGIKDKKYYKIIVAEKITIKKL